MTFERHIQTVADSGRNSQREINNLCAYFGTNMSLNQPNCLNQIPCSHPSRKTLDFAPGGEVYFSP